MPPSVLLVTHHDPARPARTAGGGRELVSALNHAALSQAYGENLHVLTLKPAPIRTVREVARAFRGHIDGLSPSVIEEAMQVVEERAARKIFLDGSNLGAFAQSAKLRFPDVQVTTFFHNAEARFFAGSLRRSRTPHAAAVLAVNYLAERRAARFSDNLVCLSKRDDVMLQRLYGRGATHISPIAIADTARLQAEPSRPCPEPFVLFVGGAFYANVHGMRWYAANVAPHLSIATKVVGKGFEAYRSELEIPGKLEVVGEAQSLVPWYRHASVVVAPIFDGSGMKTKVAEALMHGKKIIGTPEAFSGYEAALAKPDWIRSDSAGFIAAIQRTQDEARPLFDPELRAIYECNFSLDAARARLISAVGPLE